MTRRSWRRPRPRSRSKTGASCAAIGEGASMDNILKIAGRNLLRYRRRTLLTSALVVLGIVAVMVFIAVAGSFKAMMVGQITDSMLGHIQVHRRGYVASIENLPLNLNPPAPTVRKLENILRDMPEVE